MNEYDALRELICLIYYIDNNLSKKDEIINYFSVNDNIYVVSIIDNNCPNIFITSDYQALVLKINTIATEVEDKIYYQLVLNFNTFDYFDNINLENNIVLYSDIYCPPTLYVNYTSTNSIEKKRYSFNNPQYFDQLLKSINYTPKFNDTFSTKNIHELVEQIYQYINNKSIYKKIIK